MLPHFKSLPGSSSQHPANANTWPQLPHSGGLPMPAPGAIFVPQSAAGAAVVVGEYGVSGSHHCDHYDDRMMREGGRVEAHRCVICG